MTRSLDDLDRLDRGLLHVFVAGPGQGEALAIALPQRGWVLIDGCRTAGDVGDDLPLVEVLERWQGADDPVLWMVLTHPHADHADGFVDTLERAAPENVGITGPLPPGRSVLDLFRAWRDEAAPTDIELNKRAVEAAMLAIATWEARVGRQATALHDGAQLIQGAASIRVRAPDARLVPDVLDRGWTSFRKHANELSAVLEVRFGDTRLLLGGDLPRYRTGTTTPVAAGWDHVLNTHAHLKAPHHGLKVAHHGSDEAQHPDVLQRADDPSATWITPYSSSRLPCPLDGDGLERVLSGRGPVRLTAIPVSCGRQLPRPHPAELTRAEYAEAITGDRAAGVDVRPAYVTAPDAPLWCTGFDAAGHAVETWRGAVAFTVVP